MKRIFRTGAVALALWALAAGFAAADSPNQDGVAIGAAKVYATASVKAKVVTALAAGDSFRVLETAAKDEVVDGKKGRWMRISTADGTQGWLHGGNATVKTSFLTLKDFPDSDSYGKYLAWALRKGERVRAVEDYESVSEGDMGWFHSMDEGDPPILVVWDKDVDAHPWVEAIPQDCPRILSGRIYFVYPQNIEFAEGSESPADFEKLAREWRETASVETLFPIGSLVILGEHQPAVEGDAESRNWGDGMDEYVGREAVVTGHNGTDPWDRPVLTVDIDDGDYYWRAENLELVERGHGEVEDSDYDYGEEDYSHEEYDDQDYALEEAFPIGSLVILGKHKQIDPEDGDSTYWADEMEEYVGQEAYITDHAGLCPWGEPTASVDVDGGNFSWRLSDMELLEEGPGFWEGDDDYGDDDYEDEEYGTDESGRIEVGATVILGRHDEVNGGDNWAEDMDEFVGTEAKVEEILGTDSQGFLVVSVEGNDRAWRIRSLAMKGRGEPGSYGYKVGDRVVLGRHREVDGSENWNPAMDAFVGKTATITKLIGAEGDSAGCFLVRVDADKGKWAWRVESLTSAD